MKIKRFINDTVTSGSGSPPQFIPLKKLIGELSASNSLYQSTINTSLASICGNVTAVVFNNYLSQFPQGYFKTAYISTQLRSRDIAKINGNVDNKTSDIASIKKQYPMIYFEPDLITDDFEGMSLNIPQDMWTANTYILNRPAPQFQTMFYDGNNCFLINMSWRWIKMEAKMTMLFHTLMEQINVFGYARSQLMYKAPFYLYDQLIEVEIPLNIIKTLSDILKISYKDSPDQFVTTFNQYASVPISKKINTGTGNYSFFMLLKTNILIELTNISKNEGEENNQVKDNFTLDCDLTYQFTYPVAFYTTSNLNMSREEIIYEIDEAMNPNTKVLPVMTITNEVSFEHTMSDNPDFVFYNAEELRITAIAGEPDTTEFSSLISLADMNDLKQIAVANNQTVEEIAEKVFEVQLVMYNSAHKQVSRLVEGTDFTIDWSNLTFTIISSNNIYNYLVGLYRNNIVLSGLLEPLNKASKIKYE